jgi:hypothetical protein
MREIEDKNKTQSTPEQNWQDWQDWQDWTDEDLNRLQDEYESFSRSNINDLNNSMQL